ncbi:hypothetical protein PR048_028724 [Dryococelus australis]|uniref:Uncharacterized protein n=1 Tax=Dryococelus australis TaxID=614101 RepID=A0ABQ9GF33_9NEOP|nr:hypothetical protein PR048_028724 [Dryococelus australis]
MYFHITATGMLRPRGPSGLACSPPTKVNRIQSPADSLLEFRMWESCWAMQLVVGFSRVSPIYPALSFQLCSILTSITLFGSQDLAVKSHPNLFTHSLICTAIKIRVIPQKPSNGGIRTTDVLLRNILPQLVQTTLPIRRKRRWSSLPSNLVKKTF